jgi:hypothetical protein
MAICDGAFGYQQQVIACSSARHQPTIGQPFIRESSIKTLNVAGSRGSKEPKVGSFVKEALAEAFCPRVEAMVLRG